jgi:hypothetical protein
MRAGAAVAGGLQSVQKVPTKAWVQERCGTQNWTVLRAMRHMMSGSYPVEDACLPVEGLNSSLAPWEKTMRLVVMAAGQKAVPLNGLWELYPQRGKDVQERV